MDIDSYRKLYGGDDTAPGWDAIDARLLQVYESQKPRHWAPELPMMLGGEDPIDGISAYRSDAGATPHWHFVTYGFSRLYYDEDSAGSDYSGFGFELSFRLALEDESEVGSWAVNMLQNIARYVHKSKRWFEPYHYMSANGPIRIGAETDVTAMAFVLDPELGTIETPHGRVDFIQMLGITSTEYAKLRDGSAQCMELFENEKIANPMCVTRLSRVRS